MKSHKDPNHIDPKCSQDPHDSVSPTDSNLRRLLSQDDFEALCRALCRGSKSGGFTVDDLAPIDDWASETRIREMILQEVVAGRMKVTYDKEGQFCFARCEPNPGELQLDSEKDLALGDFPPLTPSEEQEFSRLRGIETDSFTGEELSRFIDLADRVRVAVALGQKWKSRKSGTL